MNNNDDDKKEFSKNDLPQDEVFERKEVFQHPQPASIGKPLDDDDDKENHKYDKEREKTSNEEGLNQARSNGDAGPFEGLENLGE